MEFADKNGIVLIGYDDKDYPVLLREISDPPPVLYVKGNPEILNTTSIGIVGTRKPSKYGISAAKYITKGLCSKGITVVSGLAAGIDSVVHFNSLENSGNTVAVLGCGVDGVYPRINRDLAERIYSTGAVVSEFPFGTPPVKSNFPKRNRIISGLSAGVAVVEAGRISGSLITARTALSQNRDVFAVPGSIFSDKSRGSNELIKAGAVPLLSVSDIIDSIQVLSMFKGESSEYESAKGFSRNSEEEKRQKMEELRTGLSTEESRIFDAIGEAPVSIEKISETCGLSTETIIPVLVEMEISGRIRQLPGQRYQVNISGTREGSPEIFMGTEETGNDIEFY